MAGNERQSKLENYNSTTYLQYHHTNTLKTHHSLGISFDSTLNPIPFSHKVCASQSMGSLSMAILRLEATFRDHREISNETAHATEFWKCLVFPFRFLTSSCDDEVDCSCDNDERDKSAPVRQSVSVSPIEPGKSVRFTKQELYDSTCLHGNVNTSRSMYSLDSLSNSPQHFHSSYDTPRDDSSTMGTRRRQQESCLEERMMQNALDFTVNVYDAQQESFSSANYECAQVNKNDEVKAKQTASHTFLHERFTLGDTKMAPSQSPQAHQVKDAYDTGSLLHLFLSDCGRNINGMAQHITGTFRKAETSHSARVNTVSKGVAPSAITSEKTTSSPFPYATSTGATTSFGGRSVPSPFGRMSNKATKVRGVDVLDTTTYPSLWPNESDEQLFASSPDSALLEKRSTSMQRNESILSSSSLISDHTLSWSFSSDEDVDEAAYHNEEAFVMGSSERKLHSLEVQRKRQTPRVRKAATHEPQRASSRKKRNQGQHSSHRHRRTPSLTSPNACFYNQQNAAVVRSLNLHPTPRRRAPSLTSPNACFYNQQQHVASHTFRPKAGRGTALCRALED